MALHASGDLGWFAAWRTRRHLAQCERCREEVESFREMRDTLPEIAELPDVAWNRIAAEMRANIRLGLAAGECVRDAEEAAVEPSPLFGTARAVLAFAGMFTLVVTGLVLEGTTARPPKAPWAGSGPMAQATADGIQMRAGDQGFSLMHNGANGVITTVSTRDIGARYMDPQTGLVTMTKLYVE
ncbi:MAG TPA: hypothetical protein VKE70_05935 [Candidatus Solibacter sp.]|nr:hypothetical protein [Candidatus Solibacter sp.]